MGEAYRALPALGVLERRYAGWSSVAPPFSRSTDRFQLFGLRGDRGRRSGSGPVRASRYPTLTVFTRETTARMPIYQRSLLALLAAALVASCIRPPYPSEMFLQHLPTVAVLIALPLLSRRFPLSNAAFTCLVLFMLLHVLGARYIYSYLPYDRWTGKLFGVSLTEALHLRRNHYDRLVHFAFGLLWVRPVWEICARYFKVPRRFAYYTAFEFVLAFSMVYELFEWGLSVVLAPESADAYNGQQGDFWDAQKDMSLALVGALLALALLLFRRRKEGPDSQGFS